MKKALPLIFILVGTALLITTVVFWIDSKISTEPQSLGQSLRDWITLLAGLGTSIKGWVDLLKKEKTASSPTQIFVQGHRSQIDIITGDKTAPVSTYIQKQFSEDSYEQNNELSKVKHILRQFITDSLREQELREIISDYFPQVEISISSKTNIWGIVEELVNYATHQGTVGKLILVVGEYNPYQYSRYKEELIELINLLNQNQPPASKDKP